MRHYVGAINTRYHHRGRHYTLVSKHSNRSYRAHCFMPQVLIVHGASYAIHQDRQCGAIETRPFLAPAKAQAQIEPGFAERLRLELH